MIYNGKFDLINFSNSGCLLLRKKNTAYEERNLKLNISTYVISYSRWLDKDATDFRISHHCDGVKHHINAIQHIHLSLDLFLIRI